MIKKAAQKSINDRKKSREHNIKRPQAAADYCGQSYTTFWRQSKIEPTFPPKIHLSSMACGFLTSDLDSWLESKKTKAGE